MAFVGDNFVSVLPINQLNNDNLTALNKTKSEEPKFITIQTTENNKKISDYSIFAVHRALLGICKEKEIHHIYLQRDGSLLLLVKNDRLAKKFIDANTLADLCGITAKLHTRLNCIRGTIQAPYLKNVPEHEIMEELKSYNVVGVQKRRRLTDGASTFTGVILLTFERYFLPPTIYIAWISTVVRPYYPQPLRCKICQRIGHTHTFCKSPPACWNCNLPPHIPEPCLRTFCANCAGAHATSSDLCPKYVRIRELLKKRIQARCIIK